MKEEGVHRVDLEILGETYTIKGSVSPAHIQKINRYLNKQLEAIQDHNSQLNNKAVLILTAFNMADELLRLKKDYDDLIQLLEDK